MTERLIAIAEVRTRPVEGFVRAGETGQGYHDIIPLTKAEVDAFIAIAEAANKIPPTAHFGYVQLREALARFDFSEPA